MLKEVLNPQNYYWNLWAIFPLLGSMYVFLLGIFVFFKNKRREGFLFFLFNFFYGDMVVWVQ